MTFMDEVFNPYDYISNADSPPAELEKINQLRLEKISFLKRKCWHDLMQLFQVLPPRSEILERCTAAGKEFEIVLNHDVISIGRAGLLTEAEDSALQKILLTLKPWRKGPYSIFGHLIDAEWRCERKWARVLNVLQPDNGISPFAGKTIADIGCNNGYYMFRTAATDPKCVIGFEPFEANFFAFNLFQRYIQNPKILFELLGVEQISLFPDFFDLVLCMGVVYHRRDPFSMLKDIYAAMKHGGQIVLESLALPGNEPVALFPQGRYLRMKNVYFLPTAECLRSMLVRAGFRDVEIKSENKLSVEEQRVTELGAEESLKDWLAGEELELTIEGHPAPYQAIVLGWK